MTIYLHVICANKGCSKPKRRGFTRCQTCIREGIDIPSGINYERAYKQLRAYLMNNWSRGRVVELRSEETELD